MSAPASVLVVGASAAGLSCVEALRRRGYEGKLTVLGAEPHLPYDRPPLSKHVLSGGWEPERVRLRPESALESGVRTASGRVLGADAVVVATGAEVSMLDGDPAGRRFVAGYAQDGRVVGVPGRNMPEQARRHRQGLLEPRVLVGGRPR